MFFLGGLSHLILKTHTFPTAENSVQLLGVPGGKASSRRESKPSACASCGHRLAMSMLVEVSEFIIYVQDGPLKKPLKLGTNPTIRLPAWFRTHK